MKSIRAAIIGIGTTMMIWSTPALANGWNTVTVTSISVGNDASGNGSVELYTSQVGGYWNGSGAYTYNTQWAFPLNAAGISMLEQLKQAYQAGKGIKIFDDHGLLYSYTIGQSYSRVRVLAVSVVK